MRLAVFADVHGNLQALEAVLADMQGSGELDAVWCLGDHAAMGGEPRACLQRLMQLQADYGERFKIIGGNTDRYLATGARMAAAAAQSEADFRSYRASQQCLQAVFSWTLAQLDWESFAFLCAGVGQELRQQVAGYGRVIGFHAIPGDDEANSLHPESSEEEAADALLDRAGRLALCGHTHLALDRRVAGWRVINPGSVGMSASRPGYAEWALLTWQSGNLHVELRALPYDIDATLQHWQALQYPQMEWIRQRLSG